MSFYDAIRVGASGAGDYEIDRSLRFNDVDTAWLQRTVSSTSNRKTFTYSCWYKRTENSTSYSGNSLNMLFYQGDTVGNEMFMMYFLATDQIEILQYDYPSNQGHLITTRAFRDPSAWYHFVLRVDTTNSTADDRIRLYVNGEQETSFGTRNNPSQDLDTWVNHTTFPQYIGKAGYNNIYLDGYLAEVNSVDGLSLAPASFGETDAITGQWIPKKYVGSYGTNGFYLNFLDNSGTTATTLGKDSSGNGNNFTPNNFSVAANLTNDSMPDTPTNNFCTLNPLNATSSFNFGSFDGGLVFDQSSNDQAITGTFFITSGKWYWEIYKNSGQNPELGIVPQFTFSNQSDGSGCTTDVAFITNGGNLRNGNNGTASITGGSAQTGAGWIRIAVDMDNKKIWFSDTSGNYFNSGNPATGANAAFDFSSVEVANGWIPYIFMGTGSGHNCYVNFGQFELNSFSSNIPTGFATLCSANLPDPTILLPNKHFDTLLYVGNNFNGTRAITGYNFQPDWIWTKNRTSATSHNIYDEVRGLGAGKEICSDKTQAEGGEAGATYGYMTRATNGFNVVKGSDSSSGNYNLNLNANNYAAWAWDAGETDGATYTVKVVSDSGNKYRFNDFGTSAVTLDLAEGGTYTFDQSDSSMSSHPMQLSTTANGTHGGGSAYSTGVTYELDGSTVTASAFISGFSSASSRKLIITVAASAPTLYYYCYYHSGMGGQANTNSTLGSSNFDGTIQVKLKVNATAGFSVGTYSGNGTAGATIGHGLGVKPNLIIIKRRDNIDNWMVYHNRANGGVNPEQYYFELQGTSQQINDSRMMNNTAPTSLVNSLRADNSTNGGSATYVAYWFSEVAGYSKFGSYTGNGNSDGTFVFTGFSVAWLMIKRTDSSSDWFIWDNRRPAYNVKNVLISPNKSDAEISYTSIDLLSNGFKVRNTGSDLNANGGTIIYLAFAESPFKNARAR